MDSAVASNYICLFLVVQFHSQNTSQRYSLKSGDRSRSSQKNELLRKEMQLSITDLTQPLLLYSDACELYLKAL